MSLIFIYSCKKDCDINTPIYFKGKLKTIQDDMIGDRDSFIPTFYLFYDTITEQLKEIKVGGVLNGRDTIGPWINVIHDDNGYIYLKGYILQDGKSVKIKVNQKQITGIYLIDTATLNEEQITSVSINNNITDTVYDVGYIPVYAANISNYNFVYTNNNCTSYTATWLESITGFPRTKRIDYQIYYTNLPNKNVLKYQDPVGFGKPCSFFVFINFLAIDGYYLIPPNQNLIDSVVETANIKQKYFYEFDAENNVKTVRINYMNGLNSEDRFQYMTYY